ncbi:MAG: hypothetical protein KGY67_00480 [Candidatus Thermoplasmatota archaeon]|nr:hypothetical protein [Candidatus Thermoplasmatota archaeon]
MIELKDDLPNYIYEKEGHITQKDFPKRVFVPKWFQNENFGIQSMKFIEKKYVDKRYPFVEMILLRTSKETDKAILVDGFLLRVCADDELEKLKEHGIGLDNCYIDIANANQWIPKSLMREMQE